MQSNICLPTIETKTAAFIVCPSEHLHVLLPPPPNDTPAKRVNFAETDKNCKGFESYEKHQVDAVARQPKSGVEHRDAR